MNQETDYWGRTKSGLFVPASYAPVKQLKAFEFFAGGGGLSCGLKQAGMHVVGASELDFAAAQTYLVNLGRYPMELHFDTPERGEDFNEYLEKQIRAIVKKRGVAPVAGEFESRMILSEDAFALPGSGWIANHPGTNGCEHFWIADIRNLTGREILRALAMERGELDLVAGGPPCQGFSRINTKRDETDPRNILVFEYARLICELNPKTMMLENVPDFATFNLPNGLNILTCFCQILADGEYAPFESLMKSLRGRKGAKAVMRQEKKEKVKKPPPPKAKAKIEGKKKTATGASPSQPALF
jgi:DNA (cytosine-5)-methyltransferase 1